MSLATQGIPLIREGDVILARQWARNMARQLGFGLTDQIRIATAVSEVARYVLSAGATIAFSVVTAGTRQGLQCTCRCESEAMVPGSLLTDTGPRLPDALLGVQRLMDDFRFEQQRGSLRAVVMCKWLR